MTAKIFMLGENLQETHGTTSRSKGKRYKKVRVSKPHKAQAGTAL